MTAKRNNTITATARVYVPKGETTQAKLRAEVIAGDAEPGLRVSCPHEWRDAWQPGDTFDVSGVIVAAGAANGSGRQRREYFKARELV